MERRRYEKVAKALGTRTPQQVRRGGGMREEVVEGERGGESKVGEGRGERGRGRRGGSEGEGGRE